MTPKAQKAKPISLEQLQNLYDSFREETDRGAAIVGAASLDECLGQLLAAFLIIDDAHVDELLERRGPLSSFLSRTLASYCMGLISKNEYNDLSEIREIRNRFAHDWRTMSFSEPDIESRCNRLLLWRPLSEVFEVQSARSQFVLTTSQMLMQMGMRQLRASKQRRRTPSEFEVAQIVR